MGAADEAVGGGCGFVDAATGAASGSRVERSHAREGQGEALLLIDRVAILFVSFDAASWAAWRSRVAKHGHRTGCMC